jgi:hypothetical protein
MMKPMIRVGVAAVGLGIALTACAPATPREPATDPAREGAKEPGGDPIITLPDSYKLEFENDYVKVVRVHYDAGARLPEHIHPAGTTAYVYLNDNEAVIFDHIGGGDRPLTRPPVKAGGARIATSHEEHHTVKNVSSTPSDFVRIWFKTDNAGLPDNVRRRIPPSEQEFSNKQARVTRPGFHAGQPLLVPPSANPSLLVAWPSGRHYWIDANAPVSIPTGDAGTRGFVRIEFLTPPRPRTPES